MKAEWETKRLGEIIQLEYGKPLADSERNPNGLYPAYGANGIKDRTDKFYKGEPSIIVGRKGSAGEVTLTEEKYWPLDVTFFVEFDRAKYELQYLYFLLLTLNLPSMAKGVKPGINRNDVYDITVTTPDIEEQRRIVTLLDEAFADIATAKANAEKNLQNARELFTRISGSVLAQYASTSQSITLEDLVEPDCSLSYGIVQPGDEVAEGLHIVRPVDMNTNVVMLEGLKRIDPALANSYARTTLKGNDILLCVRGTTGTVALAHSELAGANVTRGIVPIRFAPEKISHQFGYYLLRSEPAQLQIQAKTYGTALQQINIRDLRQLTLPVPAPQDQEIIVQRLSALEEETKQLTAAYANKLTALDDLKKSLLHQAFSGQLTQ
ncbi:restriction endonuclease subunit S [Limnohabitans sp.]|uniref:restriction endonuclease subunit S n=1 Tax=Limnohabitans sp. TaxID=1907725 RepID=UPI0037C08A7A